MTRGPVPPRLIIPSLLSESNRPFSVILVVQYRTFHNSDPPKILKLWHASNLGPSAAEGFPCDILELFVFSQPYFDRDGLIVAEHDGRIVGFVHAGFSALPDQSGLDPSAGVICGLMVHPEARRQGTGSELVRRAEQYLVAHGAKTVTAGAGMNGNGFYNGIYGGLQPAGFSRSAAPWEEFLQPLGYEPYSSTRVLHRDLTMGRDPVSARLIRHRRRLNLVITDRVSDLPWWWHVRFGQLDALKFELRERHNEQLVASAQIVGLDVYIPKWGVRAVGLRDVLVPKEQRRQGYGLSLVLEICRRLREQSVQMIEAHVDAQNSAGFELLQQACFSQVEELVAYRKPLAKHSSPQE